MNEASGNGHEPNEFLDGWTIDEVTLEIGPEPSDPLQPITGKRLESLTAERALRARLYPKYRAHLESRGIFLTPEELQEPPSSEDAKATPS